jgi:hypothetical protein
MPPLLLPSILILLSLGFSYLAGTFTGLGSGLCMALAAILAMGALWVTGAEAYGQGRQDEADYMEDEL